MRLSKTYKALLLELDTLRAGQKKIGDFKTVAEWLAYCRQVAQQKSELLKQIETINA